MTVGDVVYLRSGSPPLTVIGMHAEGVQVVWDAHGVDGHAVFPSECLTDLRPENDDE